MPGSDRSLNMGTFKQVLRIVLIVMAILSINAYAAGLSASFKEEVLLHDGSKLVLNVTQRHAGRHRPGQPIPIAEQVVSFSVPGLDKPVTWRGTYGKYKDNLKLLAVDVIGKDVYFATAINGMDTKWQHPNPPYVFFKFDGTHMRRIAIEDFPAEIKEANVLIETLRSEGKLTSADVTSSDQVKAMNEATRKATPPHWLTFVRTPFEKLKKPEPEGVDGLED